MKYKIIAQGGTQLVQRSGESDLVRIIQTDKRIRDQFILACWPLVEEVATIYKHSGIPHEELIQIGFLGLLRAIADYESSNEKSFIDYIEHQILLVIGELVTDRRWECRHVVSLETLSVDIESPPGATRVDYEVYQRHLTRNLWLQLETQLTEKDRALLKSLGCCFQNRA